MHRIVKSPRIFYAPEARSCRSASESSPRLVELPPDEAHHAGHVLRLRAEDEVRLFDGEGWFYEGSLTAIERHAATVMVRHAAPSTSDPRIPVTLLVALLKGRKDDFLVQKCVELGVAEMVFFPAERSVTRLDAPTMRKETERWGRVVVAACKQCRRAGLMAVRIAPDLDAALDGIPRAMRRVAFWESLADAEEADRAAGPATPIASPDGACALIGPEGGFSAAEIARVKAAGFETASLGPRILRAETAVLAAATLLLRAAGELG